MDVTTYGFSLTVQADFYGAAINVHSGDGLPYVLTSDYDKLAKELEWVKSVNAALDESNLRVLAELTELKAKMEGWQLVPIELIEHVKHARKLLGGNGAPEWQREKLRQKLTDLLANTAPSAGSQEQGE